MKPVTKKGEHDKRVIEAIVRNCGPISQIGLYELTHLRRSTISSITRKLLSERRLLEFGKSSNSRGRKQVLLQSNNEFGSIVAVQFDDEKVIAGAMDLVPAILHQVSEPTCLTKGQSGLISQLQSCVQRVITESGLDHTRLIGIGIADPGLVDSRHGVTLTSTTIDFWRQVPLKRIFEETFSVPVVVESKTRSKTLAEQMLGAGEKQRDLIYVDYGTGIGAGMIVDGRLLYGTNCGVGEMGHINIFGNTTVCKCGSVGCLEAITGSYAVERQVRKALIEGAASEVVALAGGDTEKITTWLIFQAACAGDKLCMHITSEVADYIGAGVASLVNLFNPSVVVLDQRLGLAGQQMLDQISRIVKANALADYTSNLAIRYGVLGEEAGIVGTGLAVLTKYFEVPALSPSTVRNK